MREGNELEAFWKRLETKRGSSALTIQDAWTGLKDMGRALAEAQRWKTLYEEYTQSHTVQAATTKATSPATSPSHHHSYFQTSNKDVESA